MPQTGSIALSVVIVALWFLPPEGGSHMSVCSFRLQAEIVILWLPHSGGIFRFVASAFRRKKIPSPDHRGSGSPAGDRRGSRERGAPASASSPAAPRSS